MADEDKIEWAILLQETIGLLAEIEAALVKLMAILVKLEKAVHRLSRG